MTRAKDISKILTDADFSGTLDVTGVSTLNSKVGILGTNDLGLGLHIKEGDSGVTSVSTDADQLVIENNAESGISILAPTNSASRIAFGDSDNNKIGMIYYNHSSNFMQFEVNNAERLRIDSSGNVAIGHTSTGGANFAICDGANSAIQFFPEISTDTNLIQHYDQTATAYMNSEHRANSHIFKTGTTERMRIDSSGNVIFSSNEPTLFLKDSNNANTTRYIKNSAEIFTIGRINDDLSSSSVEHFRIDDYGSVRINTTSQIFNNAGNEKLSVEGGTTGQAASFSTSASGGFPAMYVRNTLSGTVNAIIFHQGSPSVAVGSITMSQGNSTAYNTSSDHRLKENVTADWDATTRLKQLNPVRFNFIADADRTVDGFLAHEVQSVVPEAITGTHNEVDEDGNPVYQGIDQSKLVPLLVKTIQELEARITALETA